MTVHINTWTPIPLESARYECECGATGYRKGAAIVEHRTRLERKAEPTAKGRTEGGGPVAAYRYHDTGARNK
jgi:hypothetical protein